MISIALTKGRIEKELVKVLEKSNFSVDELKDKGRKLVFNDNLNDIRYFLVKANDTVTYVEHGVADIAVVGKGNYAGDNTQTFEDENGKKVNAITYKAFTITPVTLSDQNVSVANGTYAEGMAVKPVVTVSYGRDSLTLKEGKDYALKPEYHY